MTTTLAGAAPALNGNPLHWLRALAQAAPVGVMLLSPEGILACSPHLKELLGLAPHEELRDPADYVARMRHPDGRPYRRDELASVRALERGEAIRGELIVVARRDGGTRLLTEKSAQAVRDEQGRVVGAVVVVEDVTLREEAGERLRASEALLRSVIELLPVGVWITDAEGRITMGNPAGQRIWAGARYVGVPEYGQYQGWWLDSGKPIAAEEWALARAVKRGETSLGELVRIRCFDGSFKVIINSAAPIRDASGAIAGAIVVNEDITSLHDIQEKLRASEQTFRTVFEMLPVGLWVADRDGKIVMANPAGERIWAGTRYVGPNDFGEYRGWWVETGEPIAPEDWGLARAVGRGETSQGELIRIQSFDGSLKTVINWASPIRSASSEITGAVAVNEDVTTLYRTQEQLRAAVREREDLLAMVTHDLRNPLSGLAIWASALKRRLGGLPEAAETVPLVDSLLENTRRMSGMIDDLFAAAVAESGPSLLRRSRVLTAGLLEDAINAARPMLERDGLRLEVRTAADLPTIEIDRDRVLRVFENLIDNACKFTSAPGVVTISAQQVAGAVQFCIANSGPALPAEQLASMFQPFWQAAKGDRRGAGLGLSICRSVIEAHGGSIWAEPAAGHRVRMCFALPRVASGS